MNKLLKQYQFQLGYNLWSGLSNQYRDEINGKLWHMLIKETWGILTTQLHKEVVDHQNRHFMDMFNTID